MRGCLPRRPSGNHDTRCAFRHFRHGAVGQQAQGARGVVEFQQRRRPRPAQHAAGEIGHVRRRPHHRRHPRSRQRGLIHAACAHVGLAIICGSALSDGGAAPCIVPLCAKRGGLLSPRKSRRGAGSGYRRAGAVAGVTKKARFRESRHGFRATQIAATATQENSAVGGGAATRFIRNSGGREETLANQ